MRPDLVTFTHHSFDGADPVRCGIDLAFGIVVSGEEESCFCVVVSEDVKKLFGVAGWAIVKGKG